MAYSVAKSQNIATFARPGYSYNQALAVSLEKAKSLQFIIKKLATPFFVQNILA